MADAGHTPEDKEQQNGAPKEDAAPEAGQPAAEPDTEKGVTTGFAEAPEAAPKLVAPDSVPAPSSPAAVPAAHSHDAHDHSHDAHGHSHDAHSHSHDTPAHDAHAHDDAHPVATDIIPENSLQDQLLSGLALAVLCAFVGLVFTWYSAFPTTPVVAEHSESALPGSVEQH